MKITITLASIEIRFEIKRKKKRAPPPANAGQKRNSPIKIINIVTHN